MPIAHGSYALSGLTSSTGADRHALRSGMDSFFFARGTPSARRELRGRVLWRCCENASASPGTLLKAGMAHRRVIYFSAVARGQRSSGAFIRGVNHAVRHRIVRACLVRNIYIRKGQRRRLPWRCRSAGKSLKLGWCTGCGEFCVCRRWLGVGGGGWRRGRPPTATPEDARSAAAQGRRLRSAARPGAHAGDAVADGRPCRHDVDFGGHRGRVSAGRESACGSSSQSERVGWLRLGGQFQGSSIEGRLVGGVGKTGLVINSGTPSNQQTKKHTSLVTAPPRRPSLWVPHVAAWLRVL